MGAVLVKWPNGWDIAKPIRNTNNFKISPPHLDLTRFEKVTWVRIHCFFLGPLDARGRFKQGFEAELKGLRSDGRVRL